MTVGGARSLRVRGIIGLAILLPFIYAAAGWAFLYLFYGAARRLRVPGPAGLPAGLVAAVRGITRPESAEGRNAPTRAAIPFDVMRPWVRSRSALAISVNATLECAALWIHFSCKQHYKSALQTEFSEAAKHRSFLTIVLDLIALPAHAGQEVNHRRSGHVRCRQLVRPQERALKILLERRPKRLKVPPVSLRQRRILGEQGREMAIEGVQQFLLIACCLKGIDFSNG